MTKVFLGIPGQWAEDNRELASHYTTKMGGIPDWPEPGFSSVTYLHECSLCKCRLSLIAQVFAPISHRGSRIEERVIYILVCVTQRCANNSTSWRVLRVQKRLQGEDTCAVGTGPVGSLPLGFSLGTEEDDDVSMEELTSAFEAVAERTTPALDLQRKVMRHDQAVPLDPHLTSNRVDVSSDHVVMPCFYVHSIEEANLSSSLRGMESVCLGYSSLSIGRDCTDAHDDVDDDDGEGPTSWDEERFEYDNALSADRTYLKFKKNINANPQQCFRYCYGGKAIVASQDDVGGKMGAVCGMCGSARQYEMQLMAPLLYFLEQGADEKQRREMDKWNWVTALVFTCSNNCEGPTITTSSPWSFVQEALLLQF